MKKKDTVFWLSTVTAIIVALICTHIELLNNTAGGYLPRKSDVKWRMSPFVSEAMWRKNQMYQTQDEAVLERPLTNNERLQMQKDISRAKTLNMLRAVLEGRGLLQHILAPAALVLSIVAIIGKRHRFKRIICVFFAISSFISIVLMLYRGYFTSLGW